jgi:demethylmenaquinone methyltransferase/2-methoxy-6-polyprenyl-1,4-benzoquinol methylase
MMRRDRDKRRSRLGAEQTIWDTKRLADPHGQPDKAARVEAMFEAIAPTYELVNSVLSAGRDRYWRRRAVAVARLSAGDRVLDLCCGTGDLARALVKESPAAVVGCDFSQRMLELAADRNRLPIYWCRADAQSLPFADGSFSLVGCAFGVRNFQELGRGLEEIHRVLRRGGRAVILEFSTPRAPVLGGLYGFYFRRVLPRLAALISRDRMGAYRYLAKSVSSFVGDAGMVKELRSAGFSRVQCHRLTIGVVTVFAAWKE